MSKPKVNWEDLSHKLQEALSKEMKEVERLEAEITRLNNRLESLSEAVDSFDGDNIRLENENKAKFAIIKYLERRLYEEMKKAEDKDWEIPF